MKRALLITLSILCIVTDLTAQYNSNRNKIWAFGQNAGLDFNTGVPIPFTTSIYTYEGCASVCGTAGNLLFYTNGKRIWNKIGDTMPSGASIVPYSTGSTSQAAVIVPAIGDSNKYYIFSLQQMEESYFIACKLSYSVVDMSLDGGFGDVVNSSKGILMDSVLGEKMTAITGNSNNVWLVTHKRNTNEFEVFEINSSGVSNVPAIFAVDADTVSSFTHYNAGVLKSSPNRQKIVVANAITADLITWTGRTELYDFDPNTGILSNCQVLDSTDDVYGAEFSPDNSKLYIEKQHTPASVFQYDITLPNTTAIIASKYTVADTTFSFPSSIVSDLKLAPDGKIYFKNINDCYDSYYLNCISNPNNSGSACGYVSRAVDLSPNKIIVGLPNIVVTSDATAYNNVPILKSSPDISVYPNPANSTITISSKEMMTDVAIFNLSGQVVNTYALNVKRAEINVSGLPKGIYFIKINDQVAKKFVKD